MGLPEKTRLGSYEVISLLGTGGMGEVYRARDLRLGREVALKILPDRLAQDQERVARFEREARLLASVNHPNIAAIYGLEREKDKLFLVMELVPGRTLGSRLESGPLPPREALHVFLQIAEALEVAHEKAIVHRDLKPENVKITPDDVAKVLDFGLAKVFEPDVDPNASSQSPTASFRVTREGDILGTPAYMSPEQARGHTIDKRADIWAFGCTLYEALTGHHPFWRPTASDVLAAVLSADPDMDALPASVPKNIRKLIRRCLEKDPRNRLHDVADARIEIAEGLEELKAPVSLTSRKILQAVPWAGAVAVALAVGWTIGRSTGPSPPIDRNLTRLAIELPATEPLALASGPALALSPDGARFVYAGQRGERTQLFLRNMDRLEPTALPGTEGGVMPFFSPDGSEVGFFSGGNLIAISLPGLALRTLSDSPVPRGGFWGSDGRILFAPTSVGGLFVVGARGSAPAPLTELGTDRGEKSHRWPWMLPDARHALFTAWNGSRFDIEAISLESGKRKLLLENASYARLAPSGQLLFVRENRLMAVSFSARAVESTGTPVAVVDSVYVDSLTGAAFFDVSADGTLIYVPEGSELSEGGGAGRLFLVDRLGVAKPLSLPPRGFQLPRFSPSGKRLMVTVSDEDVTDVWVSDLDRGALTRVTFEGNNGAAIWTPDGRHLTFSSDRSGIFNIYSAPVDGSRPAERLIESEYPQFPISWSPDGRTLAYAEIHPETSLDIWLYHPGPKPRSEPYLTSPYNESGATFSPDGRWMVYVSDESGRDEVYLRPYPGISGKHQISTDGGREAVWSHNGKELFYRNEAWLTAVKIETEPDLKVSSPVRLFEAPFDEAGAPFPNYGALPSGEGFIMIRNEQESVATRIIAVFNWLEELERRVPSAP